MSRTRSPRRDLLRGMREIRTEANKIYKAWDVMARVLGDDGKWRNRQSDEYPENQAATLQATIVDLMRMQRLATGIIASLEIERQRVTSGSPSPAMARGRLASRVRTDALRLAVDENNGETGPLQLPPKLREGLLRAKYIDMNGRVTDRGRAMVEFSRPSPREPVTTTFAFTAMTLTQLQAYARVHLSSVTRLSDRVELLRAVMRAVDTGRAPHPATLCVLHPAYEYDRCSECNLLR